MKQNSRTYAVPHALLRCFAVRGRKALLLSFGFAASMLVPHSVAEVVADYDTDVNAEPIGYVDALIDPSQPEDLYYDYYLDERSGTGLLNSIEHSVQAVSFYRDNTRTHNNALDYGLFYSARYRSTNYGNFRFSVTALNEHNELEANPQTGNPFSNQYYVRQVGVRRVTLEQLAFPLTETISMDNVLGVHRQRSARPLGGQRNLVNYRFGAAEPAVAGFSSRLTNGRTGLTVSWGELGETRGSVLPGFTDEDGEVQRIQLTHTEERQTFSVDYWSTSGQTEVDNRDGARFTYKQLIGRNTLASSTLASSAGNMAVLFGLSNQSELTRHELGAYYFEPDVVWIDTRIGDDNAGLFYRYASKAGRYNYGGSVERRRDGLQSNSALRRDTSYLNLNAGTRLSSRSNISAVYSYRHIENLSATAFSGSRQENTLRLFYNRSDGANRNNAGLMLREATNYSEQSINYGWSRDLNNDSIVELSAEYIHSDSDSNTSDQVRLASSWNKQFQQGAQLGLGLGYNYGESTLQEDSGVTGYVNYDRPIGDRLSLSLQIDYGRTETDYDEDLTGLFTQNILDDEERFRQYRELSATLNLRYDFGRGANADVLSSRNRNGTGTVHGRLFLDHNGDGVRQISEPGIPGVTMFLNSIHPYVTDARGEFTFQRVGIGEHHMFVDESTLPLPLTLSEQEYTRIQVKLRNTTIVDIPLSTVRLSENDH